jgi:hypothetical protein
MAPVRTATQPSIGSVRRARVPEGPIGDDVIEVTGLIMAMLSPTDPAW